MNASEHLHELISRLGTPRDFERQSKSRGAMSIILHYYKAVYPELVAASQKEDEWTEFRHGEYIESPESEDDGPSQDG